MFKHKIQHTIFIVHHKLHNRINEVILHRTAYDFNKSLYSVWNQIGWTKYN